MRTREFLSDIVFILNNHTHILRNIMALIDDLKQAIADNADAVKQELDTVDATVKELGDRIANGVSSQDAALLLDTLKQSTSNLRTSTATLAQIASSQPAADSPVPAGAPTTTGGDATTAVSGN